MVSISYLVIRRASASTVISASIRYSGCCPFLSVFAQSFLSPCEASTTDLSMKLYLRSSNNKKVCACETIDNISIDPPTNRPIEEPMRIAVNTIIVKKQNAEFNVFTLGRITSAAHMMTVIAFECRTHSHETYRHMNSS